MFSQAHEHSSKLFLLSGLGKGSGTWTRISQLWKLRYLLFWGAIAPNLTARHNHNLSEAQVLLKKGFSVIKASPRSCGFKDFVLSTEKKKKTREKKKRKFHWEISKWALLQRRLETEGKRDLLLVPADGCSLSGFAMKNGEFILSVTSSLRFYASL